jgi:predicted transcriptional regulator
MNLSIHLTDDAERRLLDEAQRLNVSADELATAAVRDFIARSDADFESAARRVLEKNRELYRRLA